jgi:superfamily I DNA/RNA helicase
LKIQELTRHVRRARGSPHPEAAPIAPAAEASAPEFGSEADALSLLEQRAPAVAHAISELDAWQRRAVLTSEPTVVVRAQVGSGKTRVLVLRALYLHLARGIPFQQLVLLTFSQRAAQELRERCLALGLTSGVVEHSLERVGTFHSVALRMLWREFSPEQLGRSGPPSPVDKDQLERLWRALVREHGLRVCYPNALERRMEAFARGVSLWGAMRAPDDIARLAELSNHEMQARCWVEFDDIVPEARRMVQAHGLRQPPRCVLVDEVQDCDAEQLRFLHALRALSPGCELFAVGDPNQSIYSWRGSRPNAFAELQAQACAQVLSLPRNYRSAAPIVAAAQPLACDAAPRLGRPVAPDTSAPLVATRGEGAPVAVVQYPSALLEAQSVAARIADTHAGGVPFSHCAVLARTRRQLALVHHTFSQAGVPVRQSVSSTAQTHCAATWLVDLLTAALEPSHADAVFAALVHDRRGIANHRWLTVSKLATELNSQGAVPLHVLGAQLQQRLSRAKAKSKGDLQFGLAIIERLASFGPWLERQDHNNLAAAHIALALRVDELLGPTRSTYERDSQVVNATLATLLERARAVGDQHPNLRHSLRLALAQARCEPRSLQHVDPADGVHLLTFHAAKGLEFPRVYIVGCNDGCVPLANHRGDLERLEEEQRLLFVAFTRARDVLEVSWNLSPEAPQARPEPSPFLRLAPLGPSAAPLPPTPPSPPQALSTAPDPPPPPAQPTAAVDPPTSPWYEGQVVRHRRYGEGVVEQVRDGNVLVSFGKFGNKSFLAAACPLEPGDEA